MKIPGNRERLALQLTIAVLALVPILAGAAGMVEGPAFLGAAEAGSRNLDSHLRFLSGVLLAIGLAWWSCLVDIERKTGRLRLLAMLTFIGGIARLASLPLVGSPSAGHRLGLVMELVIVPAVVLWQRRVARRCQI